jgi:hypothetical protein
MTNNINKELCQMTAQTQLDKEYYFNLIMTELYEQIYKLAQKGLTCAELNVQVEINPCNNNKVSFWGMLNPFLETGNKFANSRIHNSIYDYQKDNPNHRRITGFDAFDKISNDAEHDWKIDKISNDAENSDKSSTSTAMQEINGKLYDTRLKLQIDLFSIMQAIQSNLNSKGFITTFRQEAMEPNDILWAVFYNIYIEWA